MTKEVIAGSDGSVRLRKAGLVGQHGGLHTVAEAELLEDVRDVRLDGRLADVQPLADLRVGKAAGNEPKDVSLPGGELDQLLRGRWAETRANCLIRVRVAWRDDRVLIYGDVRAGWLCAG